MNGENLTALENRPAPSPPVMTPLVWIISGAVAGALTAYFLDPVQGRRRRALVRDRAVRLLHRAGRSTGRVYRDLRNRGRGLVARTSRFAREEIQRRTGDARAPQGQSAGYLQ